MVGVVCKVWNIQGSVASKSASSQLKDSIGYILNEEKTDAVLELKDFDTSPENQLQRECIYVENDIKTLEGAYIGCQNLESSDIENAVDEMMEVKRKWRKTDGRAALHGIISLPESDSSIENAEKLLSLCRDVLTDLFPDHQAIFGVHTNTENLHVHFIVNTVGLYGDKIHMAKDFASKILHPSVNRHAIEYGFPINEKWIDPDEVELTQTAWSYIQLRDMLDLAIQEEESYTAFLSNLKSQGAEIHDDIGLKIQISGMDWAIDTAKLGGNYSKDRIVERIETKRDELVAPTVSWSDKQRREPINQGFFTPLKRYKDMTSEQKEYVRHQLAMGRNPWRLHYETAKQVQEIAADMTARTQIYSLIKHYSLDGTAQSALEEILTAKKDVSAQKKIVYSELRKQKPIVDIFLAMQSIERRAYLCEVFSEKEFSADLAEYKRLGDTLYQGYSKDIRQVNDFYSACQAQIAYANAQLKELSLEYREVLEYARANGLVSDDLFVDEQPDVVKKQ